MANEISLFDRTLIGATLYATVWDDVRVRDVVAAAWEEFDPAGWADYDVAMAEPQAGSGLFAADLPAGLSAASAYTVRVHAAATPNVDNPIVQAGTVGEAAGGGLTMAELFDTPGTIGLGTFREATNAAASAPAGRLVEAADHGTTAVHGFKDPTTPIFTTTNGPLGRTVAHH